MAGFLFSVAFLIGGSGLSVAGAIVVWQVILWLKVGFWPSLTVEDGLHSFGLNVPQFHWIDLQKIADSVVAFPLSVAVFFCCTIVAWLLSAFAAKQGKKGQRTRFAKRRAAWRKEYGLPEDEEPGD